MRYWDSSALVSLILEETESGKVRVLRNEDSAAVTWWGTPVECYSAFWRARRLGKLGESQFHLTQEKFEKVISELDIISPSRLLKERALRILATHSLKTGDALQLASALCWVKEETRGRFFVCLDDKLRRAAMAEGFTVLP